MVGEVVAITIFNKIINTEKKVKEGIIEINKGLVGDAYSNSGERQISFFSEEGRNTIEKGNVKGLCTSRFYENITIKNLSLKNIKVGSLIKIGDSVLEISQVGKRCFPNCNLLKTDNFCPLRKDVIFAKVIKGGIIKNGDKIVYVL